MTDDLEHDIARHELNEMVAQLVRQLMVPADNPLLLVEQLRGKVLRFPLHGAPHMQQITRKRLDSIQTLCDELHTGLCKQPRAWRWRSELIAYERAAHQAEKAEENDE